MGVDAADFDSDGFEDLFVANVDQEMFSLYQNNRHETFATSRTRMPSLRPPGCCGDGASVLRLRQRRPLDLFLANGHPDDMIDNYSKQVTYKEPLLLFHQDGGKLRNVSAEAGPVFTKRFPARGLAIGDVTNDGRLDVLVSNNGEAPLLLKNVSGRIITGWAFPGKAQAATATLSGRG